MKKTDNKNQTSKGTSEYRNLATNTFFSFMLNYSSLLFTFIYSFLLARLFIDAIWGILIIATSIIMILVTITSLLPPGLNFTLNYYIPRYIALNEKSKIKFLIRNTVIVKLIFLIPLFILSILLFQLIANFLVETLVSLFFILSPCILINSMNYITEAINRGFNRFNYNFLFLIVKELIYIVPLVVFFILRIEIEIEIVAWITLISSLLPFTLNSIIVFMMVSKIKSTGSKPDSLKQDLSKTFKYGGYMGFNDLIERLWIQAQKQGIGFIISANVVTGYEISLNYQKLNDYVINSFNFPLLTSFTSLNTKKSYEQIETIYRITYKVTLFVLLIISGILFFSVEFVLDFAFLEYRLIYSNFLRLIVLASIFKILAIFVQSHLNAQHKVKLTLFLRIIYTSISIPLFFIGLIFFGVEGAIIYGLIFGNILSMIIQIFATYKYGEIKLDIKKIIIQYITFLVPLSITIVLKELIFNQATEGFIQILGFSLFKNLDFLSIITFLILFMIMNFLLRTVNSSDISYFQSLLDENRFFDKILLRSLNLMKKFTRK
ncbi:MAG: oligosaccharide flippase family protein [Candidatus Odinarchaeota archaeon]